MKTLSPIDSSFVEFSKEDIETTIHKRFELQAENYPAHCAIKTKSQELTYEDLNQMANSIARAICTKGSQGPETVALYFEPGVKMIVAILAALKSGKIWVPLDPSQPRDRISYILENSQAKLILSEDENLSSGTGLVQKDHLLINLDEVDFSVNNDNLDCTLRPDAYAHIIYTSGSTGLPKGVVHSHRLILHNIRGHTNSLRICSDDRISFLSSLSHIAGISDMFRALLNGAALLPYNLRQEGFTYFATWLIQEGITIYHSVPTVFRQFINTLNGNEEFPLLKIIHLGGEPVSKRDVELFIKHFSPKCVLVNVLGATEAPTFRQNFINRDTRLTSETVPVGYAVEDKEVLLLDNQGQKIEPNQVGEIAVRSRYLASGYWMNPELTQKVFLRDPLSEDIRIYRTGDLGQMLPDESLIYLGRKDKQVKIGGQRIEIAEIETALLEHSQIRSCAVVVKENNLSEKYLAAYIVPHNMPATTVSELQNHLKQKLPSYMLPSKFVFLGEIPLLQNGKIDRKALQDIDDASRPHLATEIVLPRDDLERQLKSIWEEVLGIQPVGIKDNFFELGGTSLRAARLLTTIGKTFGKKLALTSLFKAPTIVQFARILRLQDWSENISSLVAMRTSGSKPPFFCVAGNMSITYLHLGHISNHLDLDQPFYGLQDGVQNPSRIEDLATTYIQEIATVQSEGPYLLGGVCMGGMVAFEMAQQLLSQGHEVALLALIEPSPPMGPGIRSLIDVTACYLRRVKRRLIHHSRIALQLSQEEQKAYIRLKMKLNANSWALRRYAPRPYPGRIDLFLTAETLESSIHPRLEWRNMAAGRTEIHKIPGSHNTITGFNDTEIEEAHMRVLAQKLRACIDSVLRGS